jgi:hypothetical protein
LIMQGSFAWVLQDCICWALVKLTHFPPLLIPYHTMFP